MTTIDRGASSFVTYDELGRPRPPRCALEPRAPAAPHGRRNEASAMSFGAQPDLLT